MNVARGLALRGHAIDFLVEETEGWLLDHLMAAGKAVRIIDLRANSDVPLSHRVYQAGAFAIALLTTPSKRFRSGANWIRPLIRMIMKDDPAIWALTRYIRQNRPDAVISFLNYPNISLLLAAQLCRARSRIVVSVRNTISAAAEASDSSWVGSVPLLMRRFFRLADAVVAPSKGVADDVARITGLPEDRIRVIYNPVFRPEIADLAAQPAEHPWLANGNLPVILGVGKLKPQKDFETLLRAFKRIRTARAARLIILGEGGERAALLALAQTLGIGDDVDLPGYVQNPYPYFARASVFVLTSRWEGLPNVLIEAMACGCPVVSTDCPSGPDEILAGGTLGKLVPVGAEEALAAAVEATLRKPPSKASLIEQAQRFSSDRAIAQYEAVLAGN